MRLWLKDSERRPDPAPVQTDERTPILIGSIAWAVALVIVLIAREQLAGAGHTWILWTCVVGLALGLIGLVYAARRRAKQPA